MNRKYCERWLKSCLKKKVSITATTIIMFLMTGLVVSTPIYASVLIGATENDNLTVTKTNNQGSKVDNSGITIGGAISKAGSDSVHIGDYSGSVGTRNVVIGTYASAGYDAKNPSAPEKDGSFNQSVAIGAGKAPGEGARAYGDQSIAIGSNTIARGNSSIAIGNDDVDKTDKIKTIYTDLEGKTKEDTIGNAYRELTGQSLGPGSYQDTTSKEAAVAIGVKAVAGDISLALGTGARAEKVNAVAIGTGATANRDNAVAIGGGSTTDAEGTKETKITVNGLTFKWAGGDRTLSGDVVSFGKDQFERQLKHVAPGKVSAESTDAINGSQLHGVLSHLTEDPVFMFAADDSSESNVVGDTPEKKQEDSKSKNIVARSIKDSRLNILGGATGALSDKNISVKYADEKTLKIKLAKNLTELESAEFKNTAGDKTVINGNGVTITPVTAGKEQVSLTKDGLNNGGNVIANVGGNLDGAKTGTTVPTTKAAAPINVDGIKNNAATVGDVLNAGWNLQNNSEEKDFVKPYDTVNFENGNGTTAVVNTRADRSTSTITYHVNLGKGLEKDDTTNKITVKADEKSLTVGTDGVKAKTDNETITTGDNGLKVVTGNIESVNSGTVKVKDGDAGKIATVDSVVKAVNSAAFTLKASAGDGTRNGNSTVNANGESIKAGSTIEMIAGKNLEVTHNQNGKITFATVENPSFETVQIGDDGPKFSATSGGNIRVSDKDGTNPVKITNVKDGEISKTSKDAINGSQFHKLANNTIKLAGQNGEEEATETDPQNLNQKDGIKFTVKSSDGTLLDVTAAEDTITLTPKTAKITTGKDGVPTANTTDGKLVTADDLVTALKKMGWKATAGNDGTGTVEGNAEELIKAGETVTFKAGDNLKIKQDGKNFIYSLNTALSGLTSAEFKDGNKNKVNITPTGITITKPADTVNNQPGKTVTLNQNGLNNGGNLITNVASNLDGAKTGTIEPTTKATAPTNVGDIKNNAATVGDVLNAGWNLQGNNKDVDFVKPYDTVNFINGDGTTATVETTDNKVSTVKYSVNLGNGLKKDDTGNTISIKPADKSLEVNKDGVKVKTDGTTITTDDNKGLKVVTGAIESVTTGNDSGTVKVKEGDTGKIATVDSVVNAVNSAAFTLKASATTGGTRNGSSSVGENGEDIKAGKTIEMIAGKNLNVTHNENGKIIFATVDTPTFSTVQVGGDQGPKFSKTSDGDIKVSDKDGANPVKITNVKDGDVNENSKDAINGSQFHKLANNTIKLAGKNGNKASGETNAQNLNQENGIKFTVKSSDGELLEVTASGDTITLTPKTATITTDTDGVPTATTTNGKLVTADDLITTLKGMGWKAVAGKDGTGTVTGAASELIKAGETVTFKAGDNLKIKQDGKNFIYSLNTALSGLTSAEFKDGDNKVKITPTGITITKPAGTTENTVTLNQDGLNNGGNLITNVASNLTNYDSGNKKGLVDLSKIDTTPNSNVATVGDLRNMGWVVSSNKTTDALETEYNDKVKNADEVKFVGTGAATVSGKTDNKGVRTITVDVTVPDVEKGTINAATTEADKGKVVAKTGDENKFTTVDTVVNAINSAAWKVTSDKEGTGNTATTGHTQSKEEIKAGDTVTFKAGDNLIIKQSRKEFTYSLNPELTNLSKVEVKDTAGNSVVTTPTGTIITGKDTTDPTKDITTVINAGGTTVTDKDGNTTKVDGNGITITSKNDPANPVKLTKDGLNNAGNTITNVKSNLPEETNDNKLKQDKPTNINNNNAATVGDVLNAGWNLQNNGTAKDFVKPYDTVNFADGENTKVTIETDADGKVSTIKVNTDTKKITDNVPFEYTVKDPTDGTTKTVVKATDGKFYEPADVNPDGTVKSGKTPVLDPAANPNNKELGIKAKDKAPITNVDSGLKNYTDAPKTGLRDLSNTTATPDSNVATVGDLRNLGWVVSSDKTTGDLTNAYSEAVKNANEVKFVGTGMATVSGKTETNGVRTITVNVDPGKAAENSPFEYGIKDPTTGNVTPVVKATDGKYYNKNDLNSDGTPKTGATPKLDPTTATDDEKNNLVVNTKGDKPQEVKNVKGSLTPTYNKGDSTITDGKPSTTTETAPTTSKAAPTNVDKIYNNAATVGDVLNAGWNLQNNGTAKDFVKPYDTVNFADGENTKVTIETDANGKVSTIKVNTDTKKITDNVPFEYTVKDPTDGTTKTVVKATDGKFYEPADVNPDGTVKSGKTPVLDPAANPNNKELGIKAKDKAPITNVDSGLKNYTDAPKTGLRDLSNTTATPDSNVATVGDLRNLGWVVSSDKTTGDLTNAYSEAVKNANEVKFVGTGMATVSGKTETNGVRTITVNVDPGKAAENSPFEYGIKDPTTGNVTPVVKATDGKYYNKNDLNSDGTPKMGVTPKLDPTNASDLNKDNLVVNTKGDKPQEVKNIKSNLPATYNKNDNKLDANGKPVKDSTGNITTAGTSDITKSVTAPTPADLAKVVNNAATVGDVLNAGWNLQGNGVAKDFVKPYDTVNFVDGMNTRAVVTTDENGKVSNVTYNVTGLPITYTKADGTPVTKVGDKYYEVDPATGKPDMTKEVQPGDLKTNLVNPNVATDKQTTTPTQLGNVANGAKTYDAPEVNGKKVVQAKDGKWYNATDVVNGTAKENATPVTTPVNPGKAGLVDFSKSNPTNVATVGDLMNMGWIVSSDKTTGNLGTAYNDQVRNANEVRFVGKGTAIVSGKTDDKGVRTITVEVNDQVSTNNSVTPVVYTKADGTKVYPKEVKNPDGTKVVKFYTNPDGTGTEVNKDDVITSVNGPDGTTSPTTLSNVAGNLPKTHSDTKDVDGTTVVTPTTSQAAPTNVDKIYNNAATVGDVLNAGWNLKANGTAVDFVKPYDTVEFKNGVNTTVIAEASKDGKSSTIKVDVKDNLKNITSISNEGAKDENGNPIPENKVTKIALGTDANGNKTVDVGEAKITNVADGNVTDTSKDAVNGSQLKAVKDEAEKHTTLSVNGGDKDNAGNNSPVGNLVITETTNDKGGKHYDVKLADKVTFGTDDTKVVTVDGTTGKITAGKGENGIGIDGTKAEIKAGDGANAVTINGKEGKVTVGDNITLNNADKSATIGDVKVNGKDGHITGLKNKDWTIGTTQPVSGRAATEDQLKKLEDGIVDKIDNLGWEATVGKEGTGKSEPDAKNNKGTVRVDHTTNVHYQAGDNLIVKEEIIRAKDAAGKDTDKVSDAKYTYRLNDEITLHNVTVKPKDGKDGAFTVQNTDGKDAVSIKPDVDGNGTMAVNGKDGTGVSLNGKDGSIGINGKDGVSVSMTTEKGPKGLDEENKKPRMTYEFTKTNPDGTPVLDPKTNKPVTVKENLATMNDGLHFAGDNNVTTISKKLNEKLEIVGGADRDKLTKNNIGVNANAEGKLEVQLSKELKGMTSAEFTDPKTGDTVIMNQGGITISKTDKDGKSNNVSLTREGLNNGGNNITNVKSNLPQVNDKDKKVYDVDGNPIANKNNTEAPITADKAADIVKNAGNNAATVGDVLNAGWNLQNNGTAKDFVKPYDTVNFINGGNTTAVVTTNAKGTTSNVTYNVTGLPMSYTDKDGKPVSKVGDNYYVVNEKGQPLQNDGTPVTKYDVNGNPLNNDGTPVKKVDTTANPLKTNLVNLNVSADKSMTTPMQIGNIESGAKTFEAKVDKNGNPLIKVGTDYYTADQLDKNGQPKAGEAPKTDIQDIKMGKDGKWYPADSVLINNKYYPAGSVVSKNGNVYPAGTTLDKDGNPTTEGIKPVTEVKPVTPKNSGKAGLVDFSSSNSTNAATVGDLQNMGWVVSTSDTGYNDQVRNTNVVDFKEGEGIKISGETLENGVRQIKVGIDKNVVATKQELRLSTAGIAGVAAMANIPQINEAASNRYNIAVGVGYHKGEKALAVGISGVSDGGRVVYKASAAMDSQRQTTVGLGVGYQFGKRDIEPNELDRFRAQLDLVNTQKSSLAQKLKEETHKVKELNNKVEELEKQNKMLNEKMDLILKKLGGK